MRRIAATLLAISFALVAHVEGQSRSGHLVIVGGGDISPEITRRAVDLAGGTNAIVAVLPRASALADAGDSSVAVFREMGVRRAVKVDVTSRAQALETLGAATLIWFPGGDQNRLMKALRDSGMDAAIRERFSKGATIGGSSEK